MLNLRIYLITQLIIIKFDIKIIVYKFKNDELRNKYTIVITANDATKKFPDFVANKML